jgi:hypothetical protein
VFVREHREHLLKPQVVFMTPVYHRESLPGNGGSASAGPSTSISTGPAGARLPPRAAARARHRRERRAQVRLCEVMKVTALR